MPYQPKYTPEERKVIEKARKNGDIGDIGGFDFESMFVGFIIGIFLTLVVYAFSTQWRVVTVKEYRQIYPDVEEEGRE